MNENVEIPGYVILLWQHFIEAFSFQSLQFAGILNSGFSILTVCILHFQISLEPPADVSTRRDA